MRYILITLLLLMVLPTVSHAQTKTGECYSKIYSQHFIADSRNDMNSADLQSGDVYFTYLLTVCVSNDESLATNAGKYGVEDISELTMPTVWRHWNDELVDRYSQSLRLKSEETGLLPFFVTTYHEFLGDLSVMEGVGITVQTDQL